MCDRCGGATVAIRMDLGGRPAVLHSCNRCETRAWRFEDRPAALTEVLAAVPSRARAA